MISNKSRNYVLLLSVIVSFSGSCFSFPIQNFPTFIAFKKNDIAPKSSLLGCRALKMFGNKIFDPEKSNLVDANGVPFTVGCTVMLTKERKTYSSPSKGWGKFADDNTFVPVDLDRGDEIPRAEKCCVLPQGMRGTVKRVYDMNEFDAIHPIVVTFSGGESHGGDYSPPVNLLMHLATHEVEVIGE